LESELADAQRIIDRNATRGVPATNAEARKADIVAEQQRRGGTKPATPKQEVQQRETDIAKDADKTESTQGGIVSPMSDSNRKTVTIKPTAYGPDSRPYDVELEDDGDGDFKVYRDGEFVGRIVSFLSSKDRPAGRLRIQGVEKTYWDYQTSEDRGTMLYTRNLSRADAIRGIMQDRAAQKAKAEERARDEEMKSLSDVDLANVVNENKPGSVKASALKEARRRKFEERNDPEMGFMVSAPESTQGGIVDGMTNTNLHPRDKDTSDVTAGEPTAERPHAGKTPPEIDRELADIYGKRWAARNDQMRYMESLRDAYYPRNRRTFNRDEPKPWQGGYKTDSELIEEIKAHFAEADKMPTGDMDERSAKREFESSIFAGDRYSSRDSLDRYVKGYDDATALVESLDVQTNEREQEFDDRGGWSRAFLVENTNGHVHTSMGCSTCNKGDTPTQFAWMPDYSAKGEDTIVADAGERACTTCYPSAPVDTLSRPTKMFGPNEIDAQKAREQREVEKQERLAKKIAKGLTEDGSELRVPYSMNGNGTIRTEGIKSEVTGRRALQEAMADEYRWQRAGDDKGWDAVSKGRREITRQRVMVLTDAIAKKHGLSRQSLWDELVPKAAKNDAWRGTEAMPKDHKFSIPGEDGDMGAQETDAPSPDAPDSVTPEAVPETPAEPDVTPEAPAAPQGDVINSLSAGNKEYAERLLRSARQRPDYLADEIDPFFSWILDIDATGDSQKTAAALWELRVKMDGDKLPGSDIIEVPASFQRLLTQAARSDREDLYDGAPEPKGSPAVTIGDTAPKGYGGRSIPESKPYEEFEKLPFEPKQFKDGMGYTATSPSGDWDVQIVPEKPITQRVWRGGQVQTVTVQNYKIVFNGDTLKASNKKIWRTPYSATAMATASDYLSKRTKQNNEKAATKRALRSPRTVPGLFDLVEKPRSDAKDKSSRKSKALDRLKAMGMIAQGAKSKSGKDIDLDANILERFASTMEAHEQMAPGFSQFISGLSVDRDLSRGSALAYNKTVLTPDPNDRWGPKKFVEPSTIFISPSAASGKVDAAELKTAMLRGQGHFAVEGDDALSEYWGISKGDVALHYILTHEIGHSVQQVIQGHREDDKSDGDRARKRLVDGMEEIMLKHGVVSPASDVWKTGNYLTDYQGSARLFNKLDTHVSRYGSTSTAEMFAETWAGYMLDPEPTEFVKEAGALMERLLKERVKEWEEDHK